MNFPFRIFRVIIYVLLLAFVLGGCSNQKNTFVTRNYHTLTGYFNAYYNGDLAYREGVKKIEKTDDNYNEILPIFKYSIKGASQKGNADMDRAFKKGSKVIQKHSITVKPKGQPKNERQRKFFNQPEYVKWTWYSYLLIGKSHFMRRDFFAAIEAFTYIIQTYSDLPIKYDAQLWLARTYVEMENYRRAEPLLQLIQNTDNLPKHLMRDFYLVYADYYLKQQQLDLAAKNLEEAVKLTRNKKELYRYEYILAQIYQRQGDDHLAAEKYRKILKRNPNYDMGFNARINLAQLASKNERDNSFLKRELRKMIRDDKNIDYLDQLYYALGKISFNEGNLPEAIELFKLSAQKSKRNNYQKGMAYLELGKIYLDRPDYRNAQIYFDSAMMFVPQSIPDYKLYKRLSDNLNELVRNLMIVSTQDSLQRLGRMSEKDRNSIIDKIIADIEKRDRDEKSREQTSRLAAMQTEQRSKALDSEFGGGGWYFYNPSTVASGAIQFEAKWGNRRLEDDWRRSDKASTGINLFDTQRQTAQTASQQQNRETDPKKREFYLQDIPLTDSAFRVSDSLIHIALYRAANIYKDKIEDLPQAAETYKTLLTRFPETLYEMEIWYHLYKIYQKFALEKDSDVYKRKLLDKYPQSRYAQSINNPDFYKQELEVEQAARFLYSTTYRHFRNRDWKKVIENCQVTDSAYPGNIYQTKFALLRAIAVGNTTDSATFVKELNSYVMKYPNAPEVEYARDILRYLTVPQQKPQGVEKKQEEQLFAGGLSEPKERVNFTYKPKEEHLYVVLVNSEKKATNKLKFNLGNMNIDYYPMFEFQIASSLFSAGIDIITVEKFTSAVSALNYYHSVIYLDEVFPDITSLDYNHFVITRENLEKLRQTKAIQAYIEFFRDTYLKGK